MSRKISFSVSESLEYVLHQDVIVTFEDAYISKEDLFFCLDFVDNEDEEGGYFDSFEELFVFLKEHDDSFKDCDLKKETCFDYCSDKFKRSLKILVDFGFRVESKINLFIEKNKSGNYIVEFSGYKFLPDENKGITTKNYESLAIACEKFEKIHNSFLSSIKLDI